jgi:hypothetical protein
MNIEDVFLTMLIMSNIFLLTWNIKLQIKSYNLAKQLLERERWHIRELDKYKNL